MLDFGYEALKEGGTLLSALVLAGVVTWVVRNNQVVTERQRLAFEEFVKEQMAEARRQAEIREAFITELLRRLEATEVQHTELIAALKAHSDAEMPALREIAASIHEVHVALVENNGKRKKR